MATKDNTEPLACVYIEEWISHGGTNGAWTRHKRINLPLHPVYAKDQIKELKRHHPGTQYRTITEEEGDRDIPF
jgi:hypothetical protein